jgi:CYTH domain-containing protein
MFQGLEARLTAERAPLHAEVLAFLLAHGCNGSGLIVANVNALVAVHLNAEERHVLVYGTQWRPLSQVLLDAVLHEMRTGGGWVSGANTVTARIAPTGAMARECMKLTDSTQVTATYVLNIPALRAVGRYALDHYLDLHYDAIHGKLTVTFRTYAQRVHVEAQFNIGIPASYLEPDGM